VVASDEPTGGPPKTPSIDPDPPEILAPQGAYQARRRWYDVLLRPELGLPLIAVLLATYLAWTSQYFLEKQNLLNITEAVSVVGIAAAFATVVVISGGIDLTPVTVGVIAGIVCLHALNDGFPLPVVIALALLASVGVGLLNGSLIAIGRLNPFIVTLGTNFLFTGIAYVLTDGNSQQITQERFLNIGQSRLWEQVPTASVIMVATFALAWVLLRFTRFGTHVFAVGGGEGPARLSGVRVVSTKLWIYVLSAVSAGGAGIVAASAGGSVAPYAASNSNDLLTILAAVIIGGTALTGGRGSVVGTLVGILLLGMIGNGLVLRNVSSFYQPVVTGVILLVAIILDEVRRRVAVVAT
jgi:ribose transport system permease protein